MTYSRSLQSGEIASVTRRAFVLAFVAALFSRIAGRHWTTMAEAGRAAFPALGARYLATEGAANRSRRFIDRLVDLSHRSDRTPGQLLAQRRAADFQSGNTVILDGWVVAESEALFCAGLTLRATPQA
jgi:hypothetical protein